MSASQKPVDGTGEDRPRQLNPHLDGPDSIKVYNWIRDVLSEKKRFIGFQKDPETGELVEVTSNRRIMPRYLDNKKT